MIRLLKEVHRLLASAIRLFFRFDLPDDLAGQADVLRIVGSAGVVRQIALDGAASRRSFTVAVLVQRPRPREALDVICRDHDLVQAYIRKACLRLQEALKIAIRARVDPLTRADDPCNSLGFELSACMVDVRAGHQTPDGATRCPQ
jgi:hypothetical protein